MLCRTFPSLNVTVADAAGRYVTDLQPEDFQEGGAVYKLIDGLQNLGSEFGGIGG